MLTDKQKKELKKKRILIYESRIFELEMDRAASAAADDSAQVISQIDEQIEKLKLAVAAVETL